MNGFIDSNHVTVTKEIPHTNNVHGYVTAHKNYKFAAKVSRSHT